MSKLINRLSVGDLVIYITNRAKYDRSFKHCKLVAILQVTNILSTHVEASEFYGDNLPNNIIVYGNNPIALEQTHLRNKKKYSLSNGTPKLRIWDSNYKKRAVTETRVVITKSWLDNIEVYNPIAFTDEKMISIFGRIPCCQNPPMLTLDEWERFQSFIGHLNS